MENEREGKKGEPVVLALTAQSFYREDGEMWTKGVGRKMGQVGNEGDKAMKRGQSDCIIIGGCVLSYRVIA